MSHGHVSCFASWDADQKRLVLDDQASFNAGVKRLKLAAGERVVIRAEREEDAITAGQRRYYFGRIIEPLVEHTGYYQDELHEMMKAQFFPDDGRTSITKLNHDEMRDYMQRCEHYAHERFPDAFALLDSRMAG